MPEESEKPVGAKNVAEIVKKNNDPAGDPIIKVYSYNPPQYAIYRTRDRLIVQLADNDAGIADLRAKQRRAISPLAPMRGQINGLIDGWRHAGVNSDGTLIEDDSEGDGVRFWLFAPPRSEQFKRACRYDRRVADALITVLDDAGTAASALESAQTLDTAQTLLAQVKNDIIAERTSIARAQYIRLAFYMMIGLLAVTWLLSSGIVDWLHKFPKPVIPVWTAIAGGAIGAFFSIAIGLKSRDVVIDLQNRENQLDVVLRMSIGAVAAAVLYCLLATETASIKLVNVNAIVLPNPPLPKGVIGHYSEITVFLVGFVAGFFERLVPDLLNKTNFGTPEPAGQDTPVKKASPPDAPEDPSKPKKGEVAKDDPKKGLSRKDAAPKDGEDEGTAGAAMA